MEACERQIDSSRSSFAAIINKVLFKHSGNLSKITLDTHQSLVLSFERPFGHFATCHMPHSWLSLRHFDTSSSDKVHQAGTFISSTSGHVNIDFWLSTRCKRPNATEFNNKTDRYIHKYIQISLYIIHKATIYRRSHLCMRSLIKCGAS